MGDRKYIQHLAKSMIGQLRLENRDVDGQNGDWGAHILWKSCWEHKLHPRLQRMRPETLGRIAVFGRGDRDGGKVSKMFWVHIDRRFPPGTMNNPMPDLLMKSGREVLEIVAGTVLVAEMTDILITRRSMEDMG